MCLRATSEQFFQRLGHRRIAPLAEQTDGGLSMPTIGMRERFDELRGRLCREVYVGIELRILPAHAVDASGRRIDLALVVLSMCYEFFVKVRDVDRAVRP